MGRNAAVISVAFIMMCFTVNYTFPLHRNRVILKEPGFSNASKKFYIPIHHDSVTKRSKTKSSNIENTLKKIKESTQDFGKNIYNQVNSGLKSVATIKNPVNEEDVRRYERLVLMKKYPFADLIQFEPNKKIRQMVPKQTSFGNGAAICELMDEARNVEITNRGLSGFAIPIPNQFSKNPENIDKVKAMMTSNADTNEKLDDEGKSTQEHSALGSLKNEVLEYVEQKIKKN